MKNRLRVIRAERGLSQLAVARDSGISYALYQRIEADYRDPSDEERTAIERALNVPASLIWTDAPLFESSPTLKE